MRALLTVITLGLLLWLGSFLWFIETLPKSRAAETLTTDAIVVLTGGNGRVEQGLVGLAQGAAPTLLISGVGRSVTLAQMIAAHSSRDVQRQIALRQPNIVLDYVADSTQSNASETARFIQTHHIRSIRLVTAYYHMPRSLLEFKAVLPELVIVPDPVFPENFRRNQWWQEEGARRLMFSEYGKYMAALLRQIGG